MARANTKTRQRTQNQEASGMPAPDRWSVCVHQMGRSSFDPIWAEREHTDVHSELMHILQGEVTIVTPDYQITGASGDTLYTPADTPHRDVFARDKPFEVFLVQFHWPQEKKTLQQMHPTNMATAARSVRPQFSLAFEQLHQEFTSDLPYHRELVDLHTTDILYQLCRCTQLNNKPSPEHSGRDSRQRIMHEAKQLIQQKLAEPISLDDLAATIGVSAYYLSRVFSQESGFTLSSYLTHRRMERACELMQQSGWSIKQIAYAVGYRDSHYFSRVFRRHFDLTPSTYQRQALQRRRRI